MFNLAGNARERREFVRARFRMRFGQLV
jgi:hypothetical protein